MNRLLLTLAVPALLLTSQVHAQAIEWHIDPNHTEVGFTARHLGFAKVHGNFKKFAAVKITADAKTGKLASVECTAEAASVSTDNDKRDADLRSDHFFAADKFPTLRLKTKSIKWNGNEFTAIVSLTMRDVTKDVEFKGELLGAQKVNFGTGDQMRAAFEATAKVNRKDFNLNFSGLVEGISVVADEVEISLSTEISYALPPAK